MPVLNQAFIGFHLEVVELAQLQVVRKGRGRRPAEALLALLLRTPHLVGTPGSKFDYHRSGGVTFNKCDVKAHLAQALSLTPPMAQDVLGERLAIGPRRGRRVTRCHLTCRRKTIDSRRRTLRRRLAGARCQPDKQESR